MLLSSRLGRGSKFEPIVGKYSRPVEAAWANRVLFLRLHLAPSGCMPRRSVFVEPMSRKREAK
jgi:hypothetical protein